MNRAITIIFVLIILMGSYTGVRYLSSVIHYACLVPEEDCPPPFRLLADVGWFITGGSLVPFWTEEITNQQ